MVRVTGALMCLPCPLQDNPKQRAAAQQINGWSDNPENVDISAVSVLDDDGASGVGAAAAAAVSVALARSWASAASQKQVITQQKTTAGAKGQGLLAVSASRFALVPPQCWQNRRRPLAAMSAEATSATGARGCCWRPFSWHSHCGPAVGV